MEADDVVEACEHVWQLARAVLDGRGALRVFICERCGVEAMQPASGDLRGL